MALILLRHTRPLGADGLCYGRTDLPPGPDLANAARRLDARLPAVTAILTSPLVRCLRLAEALGAARGLKAAVDDRLAELDFGSWEGVRWDRVARAELDLWAADLTGARPHGGETVAEMAARVAAALAEAPEGALVVTHMGPIRAALAAAGRAGAWEARLAFGAWIELPRPPRPPQGGFSGRRDAEDPRPPSR
ncbi:MAG: histidine phosphatase family protein [Rhodobacteraceae bacterium]|nr:histidine phosphatase family protein [Paracoccaceae bacterium]